MLFLEYSVSGQSMVKDYNPFLWSCLVCDFEVIRSMALVITLLLLPSNKRSWIRGTEWVSRLFFNIKQVEGRIEVVTERKRASGLKGAEALRQTSLFAWLGSKQPKVRAEIKRRVFFFLHPQLVRCQTWFRAELLQLCSWLCGGGWILWTFLDSMSYSSTEKT